MVLPSFAIPKSEQVYAAAGHVIRILVILLISWIVTGLIQKYFPRLRAHIVKTMTHHRSDAADVELEKRAATLSGIFRTTLAVLIWLIAIIMALKEAGFDIGPILAGAGVVGLAVGFGAQNLVQDVISGVFLLLENRIRVNDVAILNGTGGLVEAINLRTTVLRGEDGTVHVFRNGAVTTLANMTLGFSYYVFNLGVAYKEDTDHVIEVLRGIADQLKTEEPYTSMMRAPLEVMGVDAFADSAVMIKARIKTGPIQQWTVGREMNRRIKKKFDELGIEIPFPQQAISFNEVSKPFAMQMQGPEKEQLKALIREVQSEAQQESGVQAPAAG
ncbi:MAG TPA: mechanosensitive ion channel family protein [Edaphobacter sp.]|nr:mechanosensitive ion channel family protein [Edaphobacter sp.]